MAHPAVVEHLRKIGVTAVELLPVTSIADEPSLVQRGVTNYWGYATLGFLAPHAGYASAPGARDHRVPRRWSRPCTPRASR